LVGSFFAERPRTNKRLGGVDKEKGGEGSAIVIGAGAESFAGFVLEKDTCIFIQIQNE